MQSNSTMGSHFKMYKLKIQPHDQHERPRQRSVVLKDFDSADWPRKSSPIANVQMTSPCQRTQVNYDLTVETPSVLQSVHATPYDLFELATPVEPVEVPVCKIRKLTRAQQRNIRMFEREEFRRMMSALGRPKKDGHVYRFCQECGKLVKRDYASHLRKHQEGKTCKKRSVSA